ncbi:transporter substrate-binding domain-containing protein [Rheinheimera riviphila]|uniref:Transporter substrate-binding domain-containing protein n=1 Tax=Rheinheimera riviphila TaxID=1834037 RepID=A0A437R127_9GAMM|nr:transporter substrate-binding domain-containing protein [Rheinheimera riviphila]RVU40440.1 transporter substrate-binding domain-containing protein [Rheinheimera riviphila]
MRLCRFGSMLLLLLKIYGVEAFGLTAISSEKRPYNFMLDGQVVGMSVDIVHAILPQQPPLPVELMPWPRAFDTALKTPEVLIFTMGKTKQRQQQGFVFIGPLSTRNHALYAFDPKLKSLQSLADVQRRRLVVVGLRGGWLSAEIRRQGVDVQEVGDYQQALQMLLHGRAHLWLSNDLEVGVHLKQAGHQQPLTLALPLRCSENFLALSPGTAKTTVTKLQQAYVNWSQGKAPAKLAQYWQQQLALPIRFYPQHGFVAGAAPAQKCPDQG